jgi:hypothetical protein
MFVVYVGMHNGIEQRLDKVRQADRAGRSGVTITPLPHSDYAHAVNPYWSKVAERYKAYYGIRQSLKITVSPNPWKPSPGNPHPAPAP